MTLVVGYDDTDASREALRQALILAGELDETIVAVYGVEPPGALGEEYDATLGAIADVGHSALEQAQAQAKAQGTQIELLLIDESPAESLINAAEQRDARMIIIGAQGPGSLRAALLGSTTRKVLLGTHRPVLVVQSPAE
jgi:nucleotide-binding universal stress UspA family protein